MIKRLINFFKYLLLPCEVRKMRKAYKELLRNQIILESLHRKDMNYREAVLNECK